MTEILFPEINSGKNIFLVGGMNGAGKTSIIEAINYCLYGTKVETIFNNINRKESACGNTNVSFELTIELDDSSDLVVKRTWSAGDKQNPNPKDLEESLIVIKDGKQVIAQNQLMWQEFIRATIPPGITQFFFFDGEKIQEIASDDHSEERLKSSLEAALGIQYITILSKDILYIKQEERKDFVEISDVDLDFKQSVLKHEKVLLDRKLEERNNLELELKSYISQNDKAKKSFQAAFQTEPQTIETIRQNEKKRNQASISLDKVEAEIKLVCENYLSFAIAGRLFDGVRKQIELEHESAQVEAIRENASELAKRIVRVVEEPEPIYHEKLSVEKMVELENRIFHLLKEGPANNNVFYILNLSERNASGVILQMENIESSDVFKIQPLLEEKRELVAEIKKLETANQIGVASQSENEIFKHLQDEIEGCNVQIGRKKEQLQLLDEVILSHEKKIKQVESEIEKLFEKYNVSKEKVDLINECDAISKLLNEFVVRLRQNKIFLLQQKTFEMYCLLANRSGLIKDIVIDANTYEIHMNDRNGSEIKKSSLSAGEKEIFAISLLWGLAQTSQLKIPIIIDTPLSRLDSTHRDNIVTNYFPNAGEQVVILSTDTEIDKNYYRSLRSHLCGAASLEFDENAECTTFKSGYFWEN